MNLRPYQEVEYFLGRKRKPYADAVQPERRLKLEAKARADADAADLNYPDEGYDAPPNLDDAATLWERIERMGEQDIYRAAYNKRIDRRMRTGK